MACCTVLGMALSWIFEDINTMIQWRTEDPRLGIKEPLKRPVQRCSEGVPSSTVLRLYAFPKLHFRETALECIIARLPCRTPAVAMAVTMAVCITSVP